MEQATENVRKALRDAIIALYHHPEDSPHRNALRQVVYDLNVSWGQLVDEDISWAYDLIRYDHFDDEMAEEVARPMWSSVVLFFFVVMLLVAFFVFA